MNTASSLEASGPWAGAVRMLGRFHRPLLALVQFVTFALSIVAAFLLRFDFTLPARFDHDLLWALATWPAVKLLIFWLRDMVHGWWRHVSLTDILRLLRINVVVSVVVTLGTVFLGPQGFPRSIFALDFLVCIALTSALRVGRRVYWEFNLSAKGEANRSPTLIYGAGDAGVSLLREIRQNASLPYRVIGFLDDEIGRRGSTIHGVKVLGSGAELVALASQRGVETVLIAIPSAGGPAMTRILRDCRAAGVVFKTVPSLGEILEDIHLSKQIRDVAVEDLLGRAPVRLDNALIRSRIAGKTVLVSGAAGSIGSELCRQIAQHAPAAIVGFEIAETALFHIEREMRQRFPAVPFAAAIGSIANRQRVADVLRAYQPEMVFHAAAYKHVPLMEAHAFEAVENNVFGTYTLASACMEAGVADFVMISSDKAVRPTNIMGATKRVAELLIAAFDQARSRPGSAPATKFASVRFGNVLGSNGSVVPVFKAQIQAGGPVSVTHPEIQRYFMTIPEAAQLVLQAGTMGKGGETFVLDMGEPVKIADLARNLILLSGLRPDEDIQIAYTGLRPGEKLYEELNFLDEGTSPTPHEKIRSFVGPPLSASAVAESLQKLRAACAERNLGTLILVLKDLVPDYNPSSHLLRGVIEVKAQAASAHASGGDAGGRP